jgi:predicted GNAT family acetyltransferase
VEESYIQAEMSENAIRHEGNAFFIERGGKRVAELLYRLDGATVIAYHTWVDPALRGGGEARRLVDAAADWARVEGLKISPACSFVRVLFARSSDFDDVKA